MTYRVEEPEFGTDLLAALRRPKDGATLRAAAYEAAAEIERLQAAERTAIVVASRVLANERERCAKIADEWISKFGHITPKYIDAKQWASDAVKDIADAIRNPSHVEQDASK